MAFVSGAQDFEGQAFVRIRVVDVYAKPVINAQVKIWRLTDTIPLIQKNTSDSGFFRARIQDMKSPDSFRIAISHPDFQTSQRTILLKPGMNMLPVFVLQSLNELDRVTIQGNRTVRQMGDTTEFSARAFKTNPDATSEDLVNKLPGVTQVDGKIQVQGEDVKQVLVDGKVFFGDDASAVLKNLPAEVVDKIQVFDKKSDQAQFTGFDDGNTSKTINIVMKPQFRQGEFGRVAAGGGIENVYKLNLNYNRFTEKSKWTILGNSNNINELNFSSEDLAGVMSSGGGMGGQGMRGMGRRGGGMGGPGGGGNDGSQFLVDGRGGINTTHAGGVNYSGKILKAVEVNASYFVNNTNNETQQSLNRIYAVNTGSWEYAENQQSEANNFNHRFNARFEYKKDTTFGLTFSPRLSWQINSQLGNKSGETRIDQLKNNITTSMPTSDVYAFNGSFPLLLRQGFAKKGRTLSLSVTPGVNQSSGNSDLIARNYYYIPYEDTLVLDQYSDFKKQTRTINSNVTYTEPINDKHALLLTLNQNWQTQDSKRETEVWESLLVLKLDSQLSNTFKNIYTLYSGNITWRWQVGKLIMNTGLSLQQARLTSEQLFPSRPGIDFSFINWLPQFSLFGGNHKENIRLNYRTNNNAPAVEQLQTVVNNTNPLQWTLGNAKLQQTEQHNLHARYSKTWTEKKRTFFIMGGATWIRHFVGNNILSSTRDSILENGMVLPAGSQLIQYDNMDGYANYRTFISYGFPLLNSKLNLNVNGGGNVTYTPSRINNRSNVGRNASIRSGLVLSSNISEAFDFSASYNISYAVFSNTLAVLEVQQNLNHNIRLKLNGLIKKSWVLSGSADYQVIRGLSAGLNQNFLLVSLEGGRKFLKDKSLDVRLSVFDVFGQNRAIQRNITDWYVEDVQTNVLQRYYMLIIQWKFKQQGKKGMTSHQP